MTQLNLFNNRYDKIQQLTSLHIKALMFVYIINKHKLLYKVSTHISQHSKHKHLLQLVHTHMMLKKHMFLHIIKNMFHWIVKTHMFMHS